MKWKKRLSFIVSRQGQKRPIMSDKRQGLKDGIIYFFPIKEVGKKLLILTQEVAKPTFYGKNLKWIFSLQKTRKDILIDISSL